MLIEVLINGEPSYGSNMQSDAFFETMAFTKIALARERGCTLTCVVSLSNVNLLCHSLMSLYSVTLQCLFHLLDQSNEMGPVS